MNGTITVQSEVGYGSTFRIVLSDVEVVEEPNMAEDFCDRTETTDEVTSEAGQTVRESAVKIPTEVKARLPEMIKTLENSFIPRWEEINSMLMMDDVETFAAELREIAQEYQVQSLIEYSNNLYEQVQSYNVDEVEKMVVEFPKLISVITDY